MQSLNTAEETFTAFHIIVTVLFIWSAFQIVKFLAARGVTWAKAVMHSDKSSVLTASQLAFVAVYVTSALLLTRYLYLMTWFDDTFARATASARRLLESADVSTECVLQVETWQRQPSMFVLPLPDFVIASIETFFPALSHGLGTIPLPPAPDILFAGMSSLLLTFVLFLASVIV